MKYDFDKVYDRMGSDCLKWEKQLKFGVPSGLLPFWIADTDFATLPEAVEAMQKRLEHPLFGYTFTGTRTLETVRGWYARRHHVELPVEAYMPSLGVVTAMWFTIRAFTKPGDKVLVFTPVYDPFFAITNNQGRTVVDCPLKYEDKRYDIDWELLEAQLKDGVSAMIFCNPHNPVGRVWTAEDVERIVRLCKEHSVLLMSDEIHGDVVLGDHKYTSAACYADVYDKMIVYTAISKTFNMAGLESSCMIIPDPSLKQAQDKAMRDAWLMGPNSLANGAIEACYTYGDQWVDALNAYLTENARLVSDYLSEHAPAIDVVEPEGTYLMWLDCRRLGLSSQEIVDRLVKEQGMAIGSGAGYGDNAEGFLRLNIGCPKATLMQGLEKLARFVSDVEKER